SGCFTRPTLAFRPFCRRRRENRGADIALPTHSPWPPLASAFSGAILRRMIPDAIGTLLQFGIRLLVRTTGRRVQRKDAPWLECPLGKPGLIGTGVYQKIARERGFELSSPPDAGLQDFDVLRGPAFNPGAVDPRIRHFYEHTALYHLEVWSEL